MLIEEEIWKDIEGYEGIYRISNYGATKSLGRYLYSKTGKRCGRVTETISRNTKPFGKYLMETISKNGIRKIYGVANLVAQAFIPNPENKPFINHIDGNKLNNFYKNLEWSTASENQLHAYRTGLNWSLYGEAHQNTKLTDKEVDEIRIVYATDNYSQHKLAKQFNVTQATICNIVGYKQRNACYIPKS